MDDPGAILASKVTVVAALGFVPVAIHFRLFQLLVQIGPVANADALTKASDSERNEEEKSESPLCLQLTQDTMFAMVGLGFVDLVEDDVFRSNSITETLVNIPSSLHGALHFTTEALWSSAFMMRKLRDTNFEYPFKECQTPTQYGYQLIGESEFSKQHTYSIMHHQGRLSSFNLFMEGKWGLFEGKMPERVKSFGYDLDSVVSGKESEIVMVDIGGGEGEMLLQLKQAYPHLEAKNLVLQEFNPDMKRTSELTIMDWDFKDPSPEPIKGALVYSLKHIFHNLPDLEAMTLMKKISDAMAPYSRLLIHEYRWVPTYGKIHATMIQLYGGRIRTTQEWKQMAAIAGLRVTFDAQPHLGEGLVEMRKL